MALEIFILDSRHSSLASKKIFLDLKCYTLALEKYPQLEMLFSSLEKKLSWMIFWLYGLSKIYPGLKTLVFCLKKLSWIKILSYDCFWMMAINLQIHSLQKHWTCSRWTHPLIVITFLVSIFSFGNNQTDKTLSMNHTQSFTCDK